MIFRSKYFFLFSHVTSGPWDTLTHWYPNIHLHTIVTGNLFLKILVFTNLFSHIRGVHWLLDILQPLLHSLSLELGPLFYSDGEKFLPSHYGSLFQRHQLRICNEIHIARGQLLCIWLASRCINLQAPFGFAPPGLAFPFGGLMGLGMPIGLGVPPARGIPQGRGGSSSNSPSCLQCGHWSCYSCSS